MDQEFERRWRGTLPPFDGATVTVTRLLPLSRLRGALAVVVRALGASLPAASTEGTPLLRFKDWHEHDGYVREAEPAAWGDLLSLLDSEESLRRAYQGDDLVRTGFAPEGRQFYLRIFVPDMDEYESYDEEEVEDPQHRQGDHRPHGVSPPVADHGTFDLTCGHALATSVAEALRATGFADVYSVPAKEFFDSGYGGGEEGRNTTTAEASQQASQAGADGPPTPSPPSVHDNIVLSYTVDGAQKRIRLSTVYYRGSGGGGGSDPDEHTDVEFTGVLAYHFEGDTLGTILFDIDEVPPALLFESYGDLFEARKNHGWPVAQYGSREELLDRFQAEGVRAFRISPSYGMDGFVLAKEMRLIRVETAGATRL